MSAHDVCLACDRLFTAKDMSVVYLKPSHTSGGHGIRLIRSREDILLFLPSIAESFAAFSTSSLPLSYIVEEAIETCNQAKNNSNSSPTSHYWNCEPCPNEINEQLFDGPLYKGSVSHCSESLLIIESCKAMTAAIQSTLH